MILFEAKIYIYITAYNAHNKLTSPFLLLATLKYAHTLECAIINLMFSERD